MSPPKTLYTRNPHQRFSVRRQDQHGTRLSLPNGEDCYKLKAGEMVTIGIVPTEPGTYTFTCCKTCGSGHKKMKGQIIIDR